MERKDFVNDKLSLIQATDGLPFGTDALLLAGYASGKYKRGCEFGSGSGIISMLLLRDEKTARSVGVEISEEAVDLARLTAEEYCADRLDIVHSDLNDLRGKLPFGEFELVTCNPPYKASGAGILSSGDRDVVARHETMCTLEEVIAVASHLLRSSGRLCICQRPERLADIIALMRQYRVEPKRLRTVSKRVGEEPWLVLVEGMRDAKPGMRVMPPLFVYEGQDYSEEMLKIYGSYKEAYL